MSPSPRRASRRRRFCLACVAGVVLGPLVPADAGFIAIPNQSSDENILLNLGDTGTTIPGETQSGVGVLFTSTHTLEALASGQATVGAIDGGASAIPIDSTINIAITDAGFYFSEISFNVSQSGMPHGVNGLFEVVVYPVDNDGLPLPPVLITEDINTDDLAINSGQNRYAIRGVGGMRFTSIDITPVGGASYPSLVQVRVGVVPEPAAIGLGLLGVAWPAARWRRR